MSYSDLTTYYQNVSNFVIASKFSMFEIESMYPFERHLYMTLLNKYEEEQAKKAGS